MKKESAAAILEYVQWRISTQGLCLEDQDSPFWYYAKAAPQKDEQGNPLTLDEQIEWAVNKTKECLKEYAARLSKPWETFPWPRIGQSQDDAGLQTLLLSNLRETPVKIH